MKICQDQAEEAEEAAVAADLAEASAVEAEASAADLAAVAADSADRIIIITDRTIEADGFSAQDTMEAEVASAVLWD